MLTIIVLLFYGIWLWNINKEIKKYVELEKKYKAIRKRVNDLDEEVFGCCYPFNHTEEVGVEKLEEEVIEDYED